MKVIVASITYFLVVAYFLLMSSMTPGMQFVSVLLSSILYLISLAIWRSVAETKAEIRLERLSQKVRQLRQDVTGL